MTSLNNTARVFRLAIGSRIVVLTLIIFWRSIFTPYDTSASINPTCLSSGSSDPAEQSILFPSFGSAIEESIVWDSVYFVRIAQCGYEYEQSYAFLPLLPTLISLLSNTVFGPLVPLIGYRAVLGLSGYVINNVAFFIAAVYFYRLSLAILKDPETSLRAAALFCLNPASIFYSSIYSESLYAVLSIGGLYQLVSGRKNISVPWLALSGSVRSNGVLNTGYYCYETMHRGYHAISVQNRVFLLIRVLCSGLLRCLCSFVPFIAFQAYGYCNMCLKLNSNPTRPWCKARVPLLYNFIQSHYWNVGFLRYFQFKQLPNFLLASPVLLLAACSIYGYAKFQHQNFFSLGFSTASDKRDPDDMLLSEGTVIREDISGSTIRQENKNLRRRKSAGGPISDLEISILPKSGYYSVSLLPFIYHLGFMTATAFFVMHVQVSTRFLSASPPVYWFAASLMDSQKHSRSAYLIWAYSVTYIFLGSLLFSNFYPFT